VRLLAKLKALETGAAERWRSRRRPAGLVWTADDVRVDPAEVGEGQHIALDVYITGDLGGTATWRTVERVSSEAADLGVVYDVDGRRVGRVARVDGSLVELVMADAARAGEFPAT
jgi:hypothetical protein